MSNAPMDQTRTAFVIEFRFPEGDGGPPIYAGLYQGAFGWAPQLETALLYDDEATAQRVLENAYGKSAQYGTVAQVERP